MGFPLPTPEQLTRIMESRMESALNDLYTARGMSVSPQALARSVRSPRGLIATLIRVFVPLLYEAHLHLRWWGEQYFPDTAEAEYLERHASIWGIFRRPATYAVGYAVFSGIPGTVIPAEFELLTPAGEIVRTVNSATITEDETVSVSLTAENAGPAVNTAGQEQLSPVSPLPGLDIVYLDDSGLAGGAFIETDDSLRERVIEKIRHPAHGGADFDYINWIKNNFAAAKVSVVPSWTGPGSVGVIVAMGSAAAPRPPTSAEIAAIQQLINELKPVTAEVFILPAILRAIPVEIQLNPDSTAIRRAVSSAVTIFFARESEIGGILYYSRLSEAISSASGEYSHRLILPADNILTERQELAVPGAITWRNTP